jgi:hypothetical protein
VDSDYLFGNRFRRTPALDSFVRSSFWKAAGPIHASAIGTDIAFIVVVEF